MHSSDRAHPLDTVDRKFRNEEKEGGEGGRKKKEENKEKWRIDRGWWRRKREREGRKKRKLYGYICFRHFLLLMPPLKAQRTSPEIPYARRLPLPYPAQFSLFLFYRQFTSPSLSSLASLLLTDQS